MRLPDGAKLPTVLLDGPALAKHFKVPPSTLRRWASKGWITRYGLDDRGRVLFDYDEVEKAAKRDVPGAHDTPNAAAIADTAGGCA